METRTPASHQTRSQSRGSDGLADQQPLSIQSNDGLRNGLAIVDRAMLSLLVLAMAGTVLVLAGQGIYVTSNRVLTDGLTLGAFTALIVVPLLLIMVAANVKRRWAGAGLLCSSYVVGFGLWCVSVFLAWQYAGTILTIAGSAVAGIGTVAMAAGGLLLNGEWLGALGILAATAVVIAIRRFGKLVFG